MKILKIIGLLFVFLVLVFGSFLFYLSLNQEDIKNMDIGNIDVSNYEDGVYVGSFNEHRWSTTVEVTVKDKQIVDIKITKGMLFRIPDIEKELIDDVIEKQSLDVDIVSGSTVSCKAILKAIENAFE